MCIRVHLTNGGGLVMPFTYHAACRGSDLSPTQGAYLGININMELAIHRYRGSCGNRQASYSE